MPGIFPVTGFSHHPVGFIQHILGWDAYVPRQCMWIPVKWVHTKIQQLNSSVLCERIVISLFQTVGNEVAKRRMACSECIQTWNYYCSHFQNCLPGRLVGWKHLSFSVHKYLFALQRQNDLDMRNMLFSHKSCSNSSLHLRCAANLKTLYCPN